MSSQEQSGSVGSSRDQSAPPGCSVSWQVQGPVGRLSSCVWCLYRTRGLFTARSSPFAGTQLTLCGVGLSPVQAWRELFRANSGSKHEEGN